LNQLLQKNVHMMIYNKYKLNHKMNFIPQTQQKMNSILQMQQKIF